MLAGVGIGVASLKPDVLFSKALGSSALSVSPVSIKQALQ